MACEHGARGEIEGVLAVVLDRDSIEREINEIERDVNLAGGSSDIVGRRIQSLRENLSKRSPDAFSVEFKCKCKCGDGSSLRVAHGIFPQSKAWAKANIGKGFLIVINRFPKGEGFSVDLREITPNS